MWPFILTRTVTFSKTIPTSKTELLKIVHDPEASVRFSPLFKSIVQDPQDPKWYTVTERLPLLGGLFESSTTFKLRWDNIDEGRNVEVFAGVGTHMNNDVRILDCEENPEHSVFSETVILKTPFLLMPYVLSTMSMAHYDILDKIVAKALELQRTTNVHPYLTPESKPPFLIPEAPQGTNLILPSSPVVSFPTLTMMCVSSTGALLLSSGVLLVLVASFKMRSQDPYGLFHLTLNRLPSQDPNIPPATEWLNMGYWKNAKTFPEACHALALKLIEAGNLKKGGRVLDVGHGTGESLLLLTSPSVPQQSHLVGITSLEVHNQRSVERVQKHQACNKNETLVDLYHADAICNDTVDAVHPLSASSEETFDSILALDCAYHFNTRRRFLEQAFVKMAPGGTIALADICFSPSALRTRWTRLLTSIMKLMPIQNIISTDDYVSQMQQIGYSDVVLDDITADVFPGFTKFLKSRQWGWWVLGSVIERYAAAGARFVIISGKKCM